MQLELLFVSRDVISWMIDQFSWWNFIFFFDRVKLVAYIHFWLLNGWCWCSASILIHILIGRIFCPMGGACSRKQERDNEDILTRGFSRKYCKCGSLKWWTSSFSYPSMDLRTQKGECPSLLDLCVQKISEVLFINR